MILSEDEVAAVNHAVQVYSSEAIFFREERPEISQAFSEGRHLVYASNEHFIGNLIRSVPGVTQREWGTSR